MAGIVLTEAYEIKRKKLFEKNKQNECCFVQMFVQTAFLSDSFSTVADYQIPVCVLTTERQCIRMSALIETLQPELFYETFRPPTQYSYFSAGGTVGQRSSTKFDRRLSWASFSVFFFFPSPSVYDV